MRSVDQETAPATGLVVGATRDVYFWVFFAAFTTITVTWMLIAAWTWVDPGLMPAGMHSHTGAAQHGQDLVLSLGTLALGLFLVWHSPENVTARWFAVGLVGTSIGFSLTSHHLLEGLAPTAMYTTLALPSLLHLVYHLITGAAYTYGLLLFPDGRLPQVSPLTNFLWGAVLAAILLVAVRGREPAYFIAYCGGVVVVAGCLSQWYKSRHARQHGEPDPFRAFFKAFLLALSIAAALVAVELFFPLGRYLGIDVSREGVGTGAMGRVTSIALTASPPLLAATGLVVFFGLVEYRLGTRVTAAAQLAGGRLSSHREQAVHLLIGLVMGLYVAAEYVIHLLTDKLGEHVSVGAAVMILVAILLGLFLERPRTMLEERIRSFSRVAEPARVFDVFCQDLTAARSPEAVVAVLATTLHRQVDVTRGRLVAYLAEGEQRTYRWPDGAVVAGEPVSLSDSGAELGELFVARPGEQPLSESERRLITELGNEAVHVIRERSATPRTPDSRRRAR